MAVKKKEVPLIKFWTPLRIVALLGMLTLLYACSLSTCTSQYEVSLRITHTVKTSIMSHIEMKGRNREAIKLKPYSGKVWSVNLWATWCGPCRMETPELVNLHSEHSSR